MFRNLINLCLVAGILILVTACFCRSDRESRTSAAGDGENTSVLDPSVQKEISSERDLKDDGDFIVEHLEVKTPRYVEIDRQVRAEKLLEKAADQLNRALVLPQDIYLRTKDCNSVNAYYDSSDRSVTMCYELMEHFYKTFRSAGESEQIAYDKMFDAVRFVFLHETAHALIDQYDLPITGNEEDAADRCSAFINLHELGDDGVKAVYAAADAFAIESKHDTNGRKNFADEHLLQEQRFYNSLCMIYGSNPAGHEEILTRGYLPKERAERCATEYKRTVDGWTKLLEPWRKQ